MEAMARERDAANNGRDVSQDALARMAIRNTQLKVQYATADTPLRNKTGSKVWAINSPALFCVCVRDHDTPKVARAWKNEDWCFAPKYGNFYLYDQISC